MSPKAHLETADGSEAYLVVCANGFARGFFGRAGEPLPKSLPELADCARLRNDLCTCEGRHRIVRVVQKGSGYTPPDNRFEPCARKRAR